MRDETSDWPYAPPDDGLAVRIAAWRRAARRWGQIATKALNEATDGDEGAVVLYASSVSATYYAAALDAHTFGNLPDIDEEAS